MPNTMRIGRPTLALAAVVAIAVGIVAFVISMPTNPPSAPPTTEPTEPETSAPAEPETVTFGVWGTTTEVAAYQQVVDSYNETAIQVQAELQAWPDAAAMEADIATGEADPDVFLMPRDALATTVEERRNRPVLELLDARGVSLGDDYLRAALNAFSADDTLQCMPYTASPMVIYYNTDLIDFGAMAEQGLPVPSEDDGRWTLDAFEQAAQAATRPRGNTRGFAIEPTLEGLAPFILSGGGSVFDDDAEPTSLALGEGSSVEAVRDTLEVLREAPYTLTEEQLERRTPLEWFKRGRLGMIAGYRDLVPELRATEGLAFDVLPMPRIGSTVTVGEMTGLCIADGEQAAVERAADFLVHVISLESVTEVVGATGSLAPSHLQVALSEEYLQSTQQPSRSSVFTDNQRNIALWPTIDSWPELEELAADDLDRLLTTPVITPDEIEQILRDLDEESRALLDPDYDPEEETEDDADGSEESGPTESSGELPS